MFSVTLPPPRIITPREKPIPKEKPMTKWEKFRLERGLPARKKRSRLVFDPISNDWVPRWGHNSKKQIEEKHNWLMVDKPGEEGESNPFTKRRQEKKLVLEKENLKRMKNDIYAAKQMSGNKNEGKST